jgi:hypothetical protein
MRNTKFLLVSQVLITHGETPLQCYTAVQQTSKHYSQQKNQMGLLENQDSAQSDDILLDTSHMLLTIESQESTLRLKDRSETYNCITDSRQFGLLLGC